MSRVLLCGAHYGSTYVRGLQADDGVRVVGVLGRGGGSSRSLAAAHGLPLYTDPDAVPRDAVDAAVVAVGGRAGVALAERFLARGVPVLQEHPLHAGEVAHLLHLAAARGVPWHLNSHFGDLPTIRPWIVGVHRLLPTGRPLFVTLVCNPRTLYSLVDVLRRALGTLSPTAPWHRAPGAGFLTVATTVCAGIPITLMCQSTVSAVDDGSNTLVGHHLQIGFRAGVLELCDMAGPVVWRPDTIAPAILDGTATMWDVPPPHSPPTLPAFQASRDTASGEAVRWLLRAARGEGTPPWQTPAHLVEVARWVDAAVMALGPAQVV